MRALMEEDSLPHSTNQRSKATLMKIFHLLEDHSKKRCTF